jgi:hypothetical protein
VVAKPEHARHGAGLPRCLLLLRELPELLPGLADPQDQQPQLQDITAARRGALPSPWAARALVTEIYVGNVLSLFHYC